MAVGHIAFDSWPIGKRHDLRLWMLKPVFGGGGNEIAVVSDIDFAMIADSKEIFLSESAKETLGKFTEVLEVSIFGLPSPAKSFVFLYAIMDSSHEVCWEAMKVVVDPALHRPIGPHNIPNPPFIVTHGSSRTTYRVSCILDDSPGRFIMPVNQFGSSKDAPGQQLMSEFYHQRYGITLSPDQPILLASLGAPIRPDPPADVPNLAVTKSKKPNVRSQVYLAPQLAKMHPLTKFMECVNRVPRLLFQMESGLIAAKVARDLFVQQGNEFWDYRAFFKPAKPSYYFKSTLVNLTAIALTRPSANLTVDYEYLEWLGDAVYRFVLAVMGLSDAKIRGAYFMLMSNNNIGKMAKKSYPELPNSYILSLPPSLKTPELCRERLQNLNILADVVEALMAVSLMSGGIQSVVRTIHVLGLDTVDESSIGLVSPAASDVASFMKSAVRPSVIRLEASLQLIKNGDPYSLDVGQLDEARQLLISSLSKRDLSSFDLFNRFCS